MRCSMAEQKWGQVSLEEDDFSQGSTAGGPSMKLEVGENRIRVVSPINQTWVHWLQDVTGARKKVNCAADGCPLCKNGEAPKKRFVMKVIDRATGTVKVLEASPSVGQQLQTLYKDAEWGKLHGYDVKVIKGAKGTSPANYYKVVPCPKSPLTDAEKKMAQEDKTDLAPYFTPSSVADVEKAMTNFKTADGGGSSEGGSSKGGSSSESDDFFDLNS